MLLIWQLVLLSVRRLGKLFDIQAQIHSLADGLKNFFEGQNALSLVSFLAPLTDIELFELCERLVFDLSVYPCGSFEPLVMKNHHMTIPCQLTIEFNHIHARLDSFLKSQNRIFRELA